MNVSQLVESVALGANPHQVLAAAIREGIDEAKSGISRAYDQPGRTAAALAMHKAKIAHYDKEGQGRDSSAGWYAQKAADLRARGPDVDSHITRDRKSFLRTGKEKFDTGTRPDYSKPHELRHGPASGVDKFTSKSYAQLPAVLQRLVKKNVRAQSAVDPLTVRGRGPLSGKSGYQQYDVKHRALANVGFEPAHTARHVVGAGQMIDPDVNKAHVEVGKFRDALTSAGGFRYGPHDGKRNVVKTGPSSWDKKEYSISHHAHPEHGEIQIHTPSNEKFGKDDMPLLYHKPVGARSGKMHRWDSPQAQSIVSNIMPAA